MLRKLGEKHYVSLARERREAEKHLQEEDSTAMNPDVDKEGANGEDVVTDPKSDHAHSDDVDDEDESLFGAHMPGVMTRDEVKDKVDLDRVRFRIRDLDVEAQVDLAASTTPTMETTDFDLGFTRMAQGRH